MRRALLLAGILLVASCDATYRVVTPECPPDDSLATSRHPLGCGIYAPPDTTR